MTGTFDVVVVNLYPFYEKVTAPGGISFEDGIENIDIGGPAMIRAAAKVIHISVHMRLFLYTCKIIFKIINVFFYCFFNRTTKTFSLLSIQEIIKLFWSISKEDRATNNSAENLRGRPFSMLLHMILRFQNGYGSRLKEVCDCFYVILLTLVMAIGNLH